jgi:hypothetical protein
MNSFISIYRLWQRPLDSFVESDSVWFCNARVGEKKLSTFLSSLSKVVGLSAIYTNHSIRATGASILSKSMYGPSQVMAVTGHKSVQSLSVYQRVSDEEKMMMGDSLTENILPPMPALPSSVMPRPSTVARAESTCTSVRAAHEGQNIEFDLELTDINLNELFNDFEGCSGSSISRPMPSKLSTASLFTNCSVTINNFTINQK